jgi:hypothetical protein
MVSAKDAASISRTSRNHRMARHCEGTRMTDGTGSAAVASGRRRRPLEPRSEDRQ